MPQGEQARETAAVKRSKAARRRRLSYVVDEADVGHPAFFPVDISLEVMTRQALIWCMRCSPS